MQNTKFFPGHEPKSWQNWLLKDWSISYLHMDKSHRSLSPPNSLRQHELANQTSDNQHIVGQVHFPPSPQDRDDVPAKGGAFCL